jgi:hypothetical protein
LGQLKVVPLSHYKYQDVREKLALFDDEYFKERFKIRPEDL